MDAILEDTISDAIPQGGGGSIDPEYALPSPIPEDWKSSRNERAQDWFIKASEDTLRCIFSSPNHMLNTCM